MNLLKAVTAKYDPLAPFQLVYNSDPWVAYENKQLASYQPSTSEWYPVENPFLPSYQQYQPLTTVKPFFPSQHISSGPDYSKIYNHYNNYNYEDYNHVDQLIASASNNIKKLPSQIEAAETSTISPSTSTIFPYKIEEPIPAESRYPTQKYKKRVPTRNPYIQKQKQKPKKKRTTTTPYPEYYDSYEEYEPPRRRPVHTQQSSESYYSDDVEENDSYDDYLYETTTKRFQNRRKKRPTRKVTKPPFPSPSPLPSLEPVQVETTTPFSPPVFTGQTEIVIVRQAATTAPATTTTTTEPDTIITNSTTAATTTLTTSSTDATSSPNNNTYGNFMLYKPFTKFLVFIALGYGPSNGNENISFTYGPPAGKYQYSVPYFDWYSHEATRNAIVKRVRDIVTIDKQFPFK